MRGESAALKCIIIYPYNLDMPAYVIIIITGTAISFLSLRHSDPNVEQQYRVHRFPALFVFH
jgi:hypothetical protein